MIVNSPITGKPMRVVYQPDVWPFRGKEYPYVHIAFDTFQTKMNKIHRLF